METEPSEEQQIEEAEKQKTEEVETEEMEKSANKMEEVAEEFSEEGKEILEDIHEEASEEEFEKVREEISLKPRPEEEILEDIVEERIYTIPLRRAWLVPSKKRAPKAIRLIKRFIQRHMKVGVHPESGEEELFEEEEKPRIIVSNELNEHIWRRGIERPPRTVRVKAVKDKDGNVTLYPA